MTRLRAIVLFLLTPAQPHETRFVVRATLGTVGVMAVLYVAVRP